MKRLLPILLALGLVATAWLALGDPNGPPPRPGELHLPPRLKALLENGKWDDTPGGFKVITLSFIADGCAAQGKAHPELLEPARACVEGALKQARALRREKDGLYRSHLNLILGARDALGPDPEPAVHEALTRQLAEESLSAPTRHVASYASSPYRWPADQAATLASLARYDAAHGTALHQAPLEAWKTYVQTKALDEKLGLPWSEATGKAKGAKQPRGCAQSWVTRYLTELDPPLAAKWWSAYRAHYFTRTGPFAGFREWPPGVQHPADVDSGPILLGVGVAASAFAIGAARSQGDEALAKELESSADTVSRIPGAGRAAGMLLAQAIRFQARWQPAR